MGKIADSLSTIFAFLVAAADLSSMAKSALPTYMDVLVPAETGMS
jgi:hypothetical protein